jgi:hypothetical protein
MARAVTEIESEIRALDAQDRARILQTLIVDLDAPHDTGVQTAWLQESERRLAEIDAGARTFPASEVFEEARSRLK